MIFRRTGEAAVEIELFGQLSGDFKGKCRQGSLTFSNYTSHQNASVVNAVAAYNRAVQEAALKAGEFAKPP